MKPLLSFVISCYNNEDFIEDCLNSILVQNDLSDVEIIVIDDCSSDNSLHLIKKFQQDPRLTLIAKRSNGGLLASRLTGVEKAIGKYIHFIDGDDMIELNFRSKVISHLDSKPDILCFSYEERGKKLGYVRRNELPAGEYNLETGPNFVADAIRQSDKNVHGIFPNVWCKIFKRNLLERISVDISTKIFIGEDGRITWPAIRASKSVKVISDVGYIYRQHQSSTLKSIGRTSQEIEGIRILREELHADFIEYGNDLKKRIDWYVSCLIRLRVSPFVLGDLEEKKSFPSELSNDDFVVLEGSHPFNFRLIGWIRDQFPGIECKLVFDVKWFSKESDAGVNYRKIWLMTLFGERLSTNIESQFDEIVRLPYDQGFSQNDLDRILKNENAI